MQGEQQKHPNKRISEYPGSHDDRTTMQKWMIHSMQPIATKRLSERSYKRLSDLANKRISDEAIGRQGLLRHSSKAPMLRVIQFHFQLVLLHY
jgi:1,2-phenylacetyl-CoA epoxidase catalytic subunit